MIGLTFFAIVMGFIAYNTCCEESSAAWVKEHFPSQTVWQASLTAEGASQVQDRKLLAKALKSLPTRTEIGNQVWTALSSGQGRWWAVYPGKNWEDPMIFCKNCGEVPKRWEPVGEGWSALETTLNLIRALPGKIVASKSVHTETPDPREIRY